MLPGYGALYSACFYAAPKDDVNLLHWDAPALSFLSLQLAFSHLEMLQGPASGTLT